MQDLSRLKKAFIRIKKNHSFLKEIAQLIINNTIDKSAIDGVMKEYSITDLYSRKTEFLDLILNYIEIVLEDGVITEDEISNCDWLKRLFGIKEGDFYKYKYDEVRILILKQLYNLYKDNTINQEEALEKVSLQKLFDLSYDQFSRIDLEEAKTALKRGAKIMELDIFIKNYSESK